jgi:hypothetical protein
MPVNYMVPGTKTLYAQPNTMACWATVYAMMRSWKQAQSFASIRAAVAPLGQPWLGYFDRNTGIPSNQGTNFEKATGLVREVRMNLSPTGWEDKLKKHGLLWVSGVITGGGLHDRILEGITGDETGPGTQMHIMDPAGGRRYPELLSVFLRSFEAQAAVEPFYQDYQILHF